jgi:hypothetical protein
MVKIIPSAEAAKEISNIILSPDTMRHRFGGVCSNSQVSIIDGKKKQNLMIKFLPSDRRI